MVDDETFTFRLRLQLCDDLQTELRKFTQALSDGVISLRNVCPHLMIAEAEGGSHGDDLRVCQHCGTQEVDALVGFRTLTLPGDSAYKDEANPTCIRRKGVHAIRFPMSSHEAYAFRRGPLNDVTIR